MNANVYATKDYKNETTHRPKKTNPNKPNFRKAKMNNKEPEKPKVSVLTMGMGIFSSFFFATGM